MDIAEGFFSYLFNLMPAIFFAATFGFLLTFLKSLLGDVAYNADIDIQR